MPSKDMLLRITGDSSSAEAALKRAQWAQAGYSKQTLRAHAEMTASFEKASRDQAAAMQTIGKGFLAVGAAAGVGLGLAAKEAIQWESAFASVAKTFPGGTAALADLEEGLRDLALVLPATHEEIAAVAAAAGALGVKGPDILQFTHTMIDLGNATDDLDAQAAATGLAQFMNVVGTAGGDVERLASTLVKLGNNGASTEGQILEMGQRLAAAGKIARFSEADILGMASALTSVGIEAEAGGSSFSKVFIGIDDAVKTGNENLKTFADVAGMSAAEFSRAFREDGAGATIAFVEGLGKLDSAGVSLTGTLEQLGLSDDRVRRALLSAAGASDLMREAVVLANDEWEDSNALQEEVARRYETTESKIKLARNALSDAGIEIGSVLLPILSTMATALSDVLGAFGDLPGPVKTGVAAILGLVAAGGLLAGATIKMQAGLARVNTQMAATPKLAGAAALSMKAMSALPIIAGLAAVALGAKKLMDSFDTDKLKADVGTISDELYHLAITGEAVGETAKFLGDDMSILTDRIEALASGKLDGGIEGFTDLANDLTKTDEALANMIAGGDMEQVATLLDRTGLSAQQVADFFPEMTAAMEDNELRAGELAKEQAKLVDTAEDLTPAQQDLADKFGITGQAAKDAADDLDAYDEALQGIIDQLFGAQAAHDETASMWNDLRDRIKEAADAGEDFSFALEGDSQAAIDNRAFLTDLIDSYLKQIDTWDIAAMSSGEYADAVAALRDDFLKQASATGIGEEAVRDFNDAFALLPPKVDIPITQPGMTAALAETDYLTDQLAALQGTTTTHYVKVIVDFDTGGGYQGGGDVEGAGQGGGYNRRAPGGQGVGSQGFGSQSTGTYSMPAQGGTGSGGGRWGAEGQPSGATLNITNNFRADVNEALVISAESREAALLGTLR